MIAKHHRTKEDQKGQHKKDAATEYVSDVVKGRQIRSLGL